MAIGASSKYPLILAGNRDEFHARPTRDAAWWPDKPDVVGGRDMQAGGAWLALHRSGRFATVTNYRDAEPASATLRSRGHLVTEFLDGQDSPLDYARAVDGERYAGFNLVVGIGSSVAYVSNRGAAPRQLSDGIYGLSNALLDCPWDKVERSKAKLRELLDRNEINETTMLRLLDDRKLGPTQEVQSGRLGFSTLHALTAPLIVTADYGTRCSTVVLHDESGRWRFTERRRDASGAPIGDSRFSFTSTPYSAKDGQ